MIVVAFVLSIVTFVVAQANTEYYVILSTNIGPRNLYVGYLQFTQHTSTSPVKIDAKIRWLLPGWYKFQVHEVNENTRNCDSLGPIVELGFGIDFDLFHEYIDGTGLKNFTKVSWSTTLEPNRATSLIGRAIAAFHEPILPQTKSSHLQKACGSVNVDAYTNEILPTGLVKLFHLRLYFGN